MRMLCIVVMAALLTLATPHAQQTEGQRAREVRKSNLTILAGLCTVVAGTFIFLSNGQSESATESDPWDSAGLWSRRQADL
jgi:hypothetical protein